MRLTTRGRIVVGTLIGAVAYAALSLILVLATGNPMVYGAAENVASVLIGGGLFLAVYELGVKRDWWDR